MTSFKLAGLDSSLSKRNVVATQRVYRGIFALCWLTQCHFQQFKVMIVCHHYAGAMFEAYFVLLYFQSLEVAFAVNT